MYIKMYQWDSTAEVYTFLETFYAIFKKMIH